MNAAIGDSTSAVSASVPQPWTYVAASTAGVSIAQITRGGWLSTEGLNAYRASKSHRWRRVAVFVGTNDLSSYNPFPTLKLLYQEILSDGAIPIPMTIMPRGLTGQAEIDRLNVNRAIQAWGQTNGYPVADIATFVDAGTYGGTPGTLRATWDSGDGLHPNQAGHTAMGGFMAPYFQ